MQRLDYNIIYKGYQRPQIALVRRRHHAAHQRALVVSEEVCDYEDEHQLPRDGSLGPKSMRKRFC
jgi:hypothetical protein